MMSTDVKTYRVLCPGFKIPIRKEPTPNAEINRFLNSEEIIEVFIKTQSGFYELSDKSVCD